MTQKLITMTEKELTRHSIIKDLINKKINDTDASTLLEEYIPKFNSQFAVVANKRKTLYKKN